MNKHLARFSALALLLALTSCFGQHNTAPSKGVNLDDERIYGETREADPIQLQNKYPDSSPEELARVEKIRQQLYPR